MLIPDRKYIFADTGFEAHWRVPPVINSSCGNVKHIERFGTITNSQIERSPPIREIDGINLPSFPFTD